MSRELRETDETSQKTTCPTIRVTPLSGSDYPKSDAEYIVQAENSSSIEKEIVVGRVVLSGGVHITREGELVVGDTDSEWEVEVGFEGIEAMGESFPDYARLATISACGPDS